MQFAVDTNVMSALWREGRRSESCSEIAVRGATGGEPGGLRARGEQTTGARGRTKADSLELTPGPVPWAELGRIANVGGGGDNVGGPRHLELIALRNDLLVPRVQERVMTITKQPLRGANCGAVSSCCENDEAPTIDFLKQVATPG